MIKIVVKEKGKGVIVVRDYRSSGSGTVSSEVARVLRFDDLEKVARGKTRTDEAQRKAVWQCYSTRMLTHSHSDGEFPIYSQGKLHSSE